MKIKISLTKNELNQIANKLNSNILESYNDPRVYLYEMFNSIDIDTLVETLMYIENKETENIEVKHKGVLSLPKDKKFYEVPLKHYIDLAKRIGKSKVMNALNNLVRWNKNKNPELSSKAKNVVDRLKDNSDWKNI